MGFIYTWCVYKSSQTHKFYIICPFKVFYAASDFYNISIYHIHRGGYIRGEKLYVLYVSVSVEIFS